MTQTFSDLTYPHMDNRLTQLRCWLDSVLDEPLEKLESASADASFRRYFRAQTATGTFIVMDAPPEKEPLDQFIAIDKALIGQGVHAPQIYHQNIEQGFLLLEDLGDRIYLDELPDHASVLYSDAISTLVAIQQGSYVNATERSNGELKIPAYDATLLIREMNLFEDWYLKRHLDIALKPDQALIWQDTRQFLIGVCNEQPAVWVHRDYHSRNLMVTAQNSPAVIDFQDMVIGPVSYDLASLFKDCNIRWPRPDQHRWLAEYLEQISEKIPDLQFSLQQLIRWVDLTGLQRHLKVLGIFCRLNYRDGKSRYLDDLPLVKTYVDEVLEIYPELSGFHRFMQSLDISA